MDTFAFAHIYALFCVFILLFCRHVYILGIFLWMKFIFLGNFKLFIESETAHVNCAFSELAQYIILIFNM